MKKLEKLRKLFNTGQYNDAVALGHELIKETRYRQEASITLAAAYLRLNEFNKAHETLDKLAKTGRETAEALNIRALAYKGSGEQTQGKEILERAVIAYPTSADCWHNLSVISMEVGDSGTAVKAAKEALKLRPNHIETIRQLGKAYVLNREGDGAIECFQKILELNPKNADVLNGLAAGYILNNQAPLAIPYLEEAVAIQPNYASAQSNLGVAYKNIGEYAKARACQEIASESENGNPEHKWNLSLLLLAFGEFKRGWENYEYRYHPARIAQDRVIQPKTNFTMLKKGDDISNKVVVVIPEQGLGDCIQFVRYAELLWKAGAKIVLAIPDSLVDLMKTLPWAHYVINRFPHEINADYWVFMMSLPFYFETEISSIPARIPYLAATKDKVNQWNEISKQPEKFKIGLVWAGRPTHGNDKNRSMQLDDFSFLSKFTNVTLYSLQMGEREQDTRPEGMEIIELGAKIQSFSDTAAILHQLDLLITVDSSPAHLAGALGIPVFVMIPFICDFRWMFNTDQSPWYPKMRLFRQEKVGDWGLALSNVKENLIGLMQNHEPVQRRVIESFAIQDKQQLNESGFNAVLKKAIELHTNGQINEAINLYQWVIEYDENNVDAIRNLAVAYRGLEKFDEAYKLYEKGLELAPDDKIMLTNFGNLLVDRKESEKAEELALKSLKIDDQQSGAWYVLAVARHQLVKDELAFEAINKAVEFEPKRHSFLILKGVIALKLEKYEIAFTTLSHLEQQGDDSVDVLSALGQYYLSQQNPAMALSYYNKVIDRDPKNAAVLLNRGNLYYGLKDLNRAENDTRAAMEARNDFADAHFNLALLLLMQGRYLEGWEEYEWRMHTNRMSFDKTDLPTLSQPQWAGQDLNGKAILIFPEQGFGDTLQFLRYAEYLKRDGANVIVASKPPLIEITKTCPWVDKVIGNGEATGAYHYWSFPMSLPHYYQTTLETIPASLPYFFANEDKKAEWKQKIESKSNKNLIKVCLVWAGSSVHGNDKNRSMALELFAPLMLIEGVEWYCLHMRENAEPVYEMNGIIIHNLGRDVEDFTDSAAILTHMDLLISVDSAPLHLAGAMNRPAWGMIAWVPDFRWLLDRTDSPWYSSIKLFRQKQAQDWTSVIAEVKDDLVKFVQNCSKALIPETPIESTHDSVKKQLQEYKAELDTLKMKIQTLESKLSALDDKNDIGL